MSDIGVLGIYFCLFLGLYFEVFLLISFLEKRPAKKTAARPTYYPTVTILVPCWNKAATLGATVRSLLALDYPKEKLSILIIDDGSTDNTYEAAMQFADQPQVTVLRKKNEGSKFSALNFGIAHSSGELVGCLDADSFVERDALLEVVKTFEKDKTVMAVTPAMRVHLPRNMLELMQAVEYTFGVFYRKMFDNLSAITVLPGPFSFYRRTVFEKIGGFRKAHHTEDMEMAFRMHARGLKIANAHTAIVSTKVPTTVRSLIRQRVRWSRGFLENSLDYSFMFFNRRYGNMGLLALPFGVAAFLAGLYTALYAALTVLSNGIARVLDLIATGVPITTSLSLPTFDWFFLNTSMLTFLICATLALMLVSILIGSRIAENRLSVYSVASYFLLFGFVAPLWLARALFDAALARETGWLT